MSTIDLTHWSGLDRVQNIEMEIKKLWDDINGGGGSSSGLPAGWYNVVTDFGLVGDNSTDNTTALQTAIDAVPIAASNAAVTWFWPTGQFLFQNPVIFPGASIRNMGAGAMGWNDQRYLTSIHGGSGCNGAEIFLVDGGTGSNHFIGPSFEFFSFTPHLPATYTNMTGLKFSRVDRCRVRNCLFLYLNVGMYLEENGFDCAWHDLQYLIFNDCKTGFLSQSSNSYALIAPQSSNCGVGFDLQTLTNQVIIRDAKINTPVATGTYFTGGSKIGCHMQAYSNYFSGTIELTTGANGRVGVQVSDSGAIPGTTGSGNIIDVYSIEGGGGSGANETGVLIDSGCNDNQTRIGFQSSFSATGLPYSDSGKRNRINGGYAGAAADRPTSNKLNKGSIWFATDTGAATYNDGTGWKNLPGTVSVIQKASNQTVNNSSTLANDNDFKITFTGNSTAVYHLELFLLVTSTNTTMDFKAGWTSAICSGRWGTVSADATFPAFEAVATANTPVVLNPLTTNIATGTMTNTGSDVVGLKFEAIVSDNGTSGTLNFMWAQNTASAADLTVGANSYMRITTVHS